MNKKILVVGLGKFGRAVTHMLATEPSCTTVVADRDPNRAIVLAGRLPLRCQPFMESVKDREGLEAAMTEVQAVVSCAPAPANPLIARCCAEKKIHYFDISNTDLAVRPLLEENFEFKSAVVPMCGICPGFLTIAANKMVEDMDAITALTIRAGILPEQPNNRLKYNIVYDADEVVSEYTQPSEALRNYKLTHIQSLEERENLVIGGQAFEAFTTSGALGTLCQSYQGKVKSLEFKSIRYPGHLDLMRFLLDDLRFRKHQSDLALLFRRALPRASHDIAVMSIRAIGYINNQYTERTFWRILHGQSVGSSAFTGNQIGTAAGVCGVMDRMLAGDIPPVGYIRQEEISYDSFVTSAFGKYYAR